MNQDCIPILSRVINPLASKHKMRAVFPLPVWDNTGDLIGVTISRDVKMGRQDCSAEASFVLSSSELRDDDTIRKKTELAIAAIENEIQMHIRPKRKMKAA